jgi:hypothetical protein
MCILFYDPKNNVLQAGNMHGHRTKCHMCGEARYLQGTQKPRRVIYYFPLKEWFRDLYRRPDVAALMNNDAAPDSYPPGQSHTHLNFGLWSLNV